jgi:hypothetical protein
LALERYTAVDVVQVLDHPNPADTDKDTIILVNIILPQINHVIFVCCNKRNSSAMNSPFFSVVPALEGSSGLDAIRVFESCHTDSIE